MADPIQLGTNVLYFPKADLTRGKGFKLATQRGVAVCTRRFVFMIPTQEVAVGALSTRITTTGPSGSLQATVEAMLHRPGMTVDGLEQELAQLLVADQVFEVPNLEMFKVWTFGPLSQVRMKAQGSIAPTVFVPRGSGAVKQVKAFYA